MINQLILEGRVVKTETKNTKKGNKYFSLVIAYDTVFKEKGKWEKKNKLHKRLLLEKSKSKTIRINKTWDTINNRGESRAGIY